MVRADASEAARRRRVAEAYESIRTKPVLSTTLDRVRWSVEADDQVRGLPQPLQLGHGTGYLLDHVAVPVSPDDLILGRVLEEVPDAEGERFYQESIARWGGWPQPPWMKDGGHECFAWERILRFGLAGLEEQARCEWERRQAEGASGATLDFLRGAEMVTQAHRRYARRYAAAAREAGLHEAAARCEAIADQAPATFAEALQLIWLITLAYCAMLAFNSTLTQGRLDELLLAFYRDDLADGRLTPEEAGELVQDYYCKTNLILGRGEHQMGGGSERDTGCLRNLCYDAPHYVMLGGRRKDASPAANELTRLFLERVVPGLKNPFVILRYTPDLPAPLWRLACEKMRANATLMVYNDADIIPAMVHAGIAEEDAAGYTLHACNWPDVPGVERAVAILDRPLPQLFLRAFLGEDGETPPPLSGIDDLYERFFALFGGEIGRVCGDVRHRRAAWDAEAPGILRIDDCFLDGPVANARSWQLGGVRYNTVTCVIHSLATAADCFAAVDHLVFRTGQVSLEELRAALRDDFAGHERVRRLCLEAPKLGRDDDFADGHAVRVLTGLLDPIDAEAGLGGPDPVVVFTCIETDMRYRYTGAATGATPDGRHAGMPTSENTSPTHGSCTEGLTAMLRSLAKLPFHRIHSGARNIRLRPRLVAGDEGLSRLTALLDAYFRMGGLQVQLSLADTEELRDAQEHPEAHRDLVVRITGYSAIFTDMTPGAQAEIIRREECCA